MIPLRVAALLSWLAVTLLAGLALYAGARRDVQARFETGARVVHRVLSQRSEQQEAVLASVTALTRAGVSGEALAQYAAAMRAQYPQVVGVQRCTPTACEALGPDRPALPGPAVPADPVGLRWHPADPHVYALTQGGVRVWVDARRLYRPEDFPDGGSAFRVRRPRNGAVLIGQAARVPEGRLDRALPVLSVTKVLGNAAQPFVFEGTHRLRWAELPLAGFAGLAGLAGLAAALLVRLVEGRERARAAAREAARALDVERARAARALHAVSEALVVTDAAHRVVLANPAAHALLGGSPEGRDLREVARFRATLDQRPFDADAFWRADAPAELPEGVTLLAPGGPRLVEGALSPVADADGRPAGRVLVLRDVGPLRARVVAALEEGERRVRAHEEMLAHATRLATLGEMGAGLAHELNQPLTAIVSHGQAARRLLDGGPEQAERVRRSVEAMVAQAKRAADIIAHLRGLVKRAPARARPVDVNQVVENAATLVAPDLARGGVTLRLRLHPAALDVVADPVHLEQVLLNLLRNAGDAAGGRPGAHVDVVTARRGGHVTVDVLDSGPGLGDDVLDRLFTPFATTKPDGLGLGLSLSQTLVQGMNGALTGENRADGGAVFTVALPPLAANAEATRA